MQDLASTSTDTGPGVARTCRVPARVGLLGNPSDGYYGSCMSFSLLNFHAEVRLQPSERLRLIPHPRFDAHDYSSMQQLSSRINSCGFYGGVRLLAVSAPCNMHA
jgi:glucuronokinase